MRFRRLLQKLVAVKRIDLILQECFLVKFDILCLELSHQARSGSFMCVIVISTALSHVDFATICKHAKHALIRFYTGCVGLQIFDLRHNYIFFSDCYIFCAKMYLKFTIFRLHVLHSRIFSRIVSKISFVLFLDFHTQDNDALMICFEKWHFHISLNFHNSTLELKLGVKWNI